MTPALTFEAAQQAAQDLNAPPRAVRHRLPEERASITHKFSIAGHEGYITVGLYPTGQPGEIFIKMAKEGSTVSGLMDAFATSISLALQHGVPLRVLCEKFAHTRFEPSGWTGNEQIGYAKSLMDYIFRWLNLRFLSGEQLTLFAGLSPQAPQLPASPTILPESEPDEEHGISQSQLSRLAEEVARKLNQVQQQHRHGQHYASRRRHRAGDSGQRRDGRESHARPLHAGPRHLSRRRRHARHVRHGRCAKLRYLRRHHGPQRKLLPLHELRLNQRMQLKAQGHGCAQLLSGCRSSSASSPSSHSPGFRLHRRRLPVQLAGSLACRTSYRWRQPARYCRIPLR